MEKNTSVIVRDASTKFTGNVDTDNWIFSKLSETDFMNFYKAAPQLNVFQRDDFWRQRFCKRHGNVPKPETKTWKQMTLHLGWYNWCKEDWFAILGLSPAVKKQLELAVKDFFDHRARIWESGLMAATKNQDRDLIMFFIWKGASCWNDGLKIAASVGNQELTDLFISYGADDYASASRAAKENGHLELSEKLL